MKTLFSWLGGALLFATSQLNAQAIFQSYYQWNNIINVDHGSFKKVKTWMNGTTANYFAVGGANNPTENNPMATLSRIDGSTGNMVFTKIITTPFAVTQTFEAVSVAISDNAVSPIIAVLCNHDNGTGKRQSMLYKFDSNGTLQGAVYLDEGTGVDVVYNPQATAFNVLCEVPVGSGSDFEITSINPFFLTTNWVSRFNWAAFDKPTSLVIDNGDIVAAGSTFNGFDRQILMVVTTGGGQLVWGQAFGLLNRHEVISDVVFYVNAENQFRYGFCGSDEGTGQALIGDVSAGGPQFGFTERYITSVNSIQEKMHANAIARTNTSIFICGAFDGGSPFIASFSKNANLTPLNFRFFDDGETVPEGLLDIQFEPNQTRIVSVGYQQRNVAWNGSPANQNYSWLMTLSQTGAANCRIAANAATSLFSGTTAAALVSTAASASGLTFTGYANPTFVSSLNNCITPARMINPDAEEEESTISFSALYPNPGTGIFYLDGVVDEIQKASIQISDMSGRLVYEQQLTAGTTKQSIDLSNLPNGVYLYSLIVNGERQQTDRLILTH
ncbi:MAG: T9SS type A sorting domain-containing protein [Bacteroidia bacterium]